MNLTLQQALTNVKVCLPNDNEIETILSWCNLECSLPNWRVWMDNNNYILYINKNEIGIKKNKKYPIKIKDIYIKADIKYILTKSSHVMIITKENNISLLMLGNDKLFRLRCYIDNKWIEQSPLSLGIDVLRTFIANIDNELFKPSKLNVLVAQYQNNLELENILSLK